MFAMIDDKTTLLCLQQVLDQSGVQYRRVKLGEKGVFFLQGRERKPKKVYRQRQK